MIRTVRTALAVLIVLTLGGCGGADQATDNGAPRDATPAGERDRTVLDEATAASTEFDEDIIEAAPGIASETAAPVDEGLVVAGADGPLAVEYDGTEYLAPALAEPATKRGNGVVVAVESAGVMDLSHVPEMDRDMMTSGEPQAHSLIWFVGQVRNNRQNPIGVYASSSTAVIGGEQYEAALGITEDPGSMNGLRPGASEDFTAAFLSRDPAAEVAEADTATLIIPAVSDNETFDNVTGELEFDIDWQDTAS